MNLFLHRYPTSAQYNEVAALLVQKFPVLSEENFGSTPYVSILRMQCNIMKLSVFLRKLHMCLHLIDFCIFVKRGRGYSTIIIAA